MSVDIDGATIPVRHQPYSFGVKRLLSFSKEYESAERELSGTFLTPGMHVIEMGTSIGVVSAVAAQRIGSGGMLVTVEADERLAAHSRSWLEGHTSPVKVLTGCAFPVWRLPTGFQVVDFDAGKGSLGGIVNFSLEDSQVRASSSDDANTVWDVERICSNYMPFPNALIIDIEGSEFVMTLFDLDFPRSIEFVLIELHPHLYPEGTRTQEAIISRILEAGYELTQNMRDTYLFNRIEGPANL